MADNTIDSVDELTGVLDNASGIGGTTNFNELTNRPSYNGVQMTNTTNIPLVIPTTLTSNSLVVGGTNQNFTVELSQNDINLISTIDGKVNISDIVDNTTSTDTNKPLSANQGRILYNMAAELAENGQNRGSFATYAALIAAIPTPNKGDYAYVEADENHNGETWRYDQASNDGGVTLFWSPTVKINEVPRDFTQEPIQTNEIADGSITSAKLDSVTVTTFVNNLINASIGTFLGGSS